MMFLLQVLEAFLAGLQLQENEESKVALKRELDELQLVSDHNTSMQEAAVQNVAGGIKANMALFCHEINIDCLQTCSISSSWLESHCFSDSVRFTPTSTTSLFSLRLQDVDVLHASDVNLGDVDAVPHQRLQLKIKELHGSIKAPDKLPSTFGLSWEDNAACLEHLPFEELAQSYGHAVTAPRKHHASSGMSRHIACIAAKDISLQGTIQERSIAAPTAPEGAHAFLVELLDRTETNGDGLVKLGGFSVMAMPHALPMALGSLADWSDAFKQLSTVQQAAQARTFHQRSAFIIHLLERVESRLKVGL
jgi:hypothetical protein